MPRQHFEAIADVLRDAPPEDREAADRIARELARTFKRFNPNFDRARFLSAAGVR